ncbi:MAG: lactonase family protein [Gemmatimonadaceae bacterium]
METFMKLVRIVAVLGLGACVSRDATAPTPSQDIVRGSTPDNVVGAVYTLTNSATANVVRAFARASDGTLEFVADYPTGGQGNGAAGLGSQGAVIIAEQRFLLAVNAGSNQISSFRIGGGGSLTLIETIPSGGTLPVSIASFGGLVYVLNAGGTDNVTGFRLDNSGDLTHIPGSTRPLSGVGTAAAQVGFHPSGRLLVVTEKATNKIDVYSVNKDGTLTGPTVHTSNGATPFGFEFSQRGYLVVSEAFGGMPDASATSSYSLDGAGSLNTISASIATFETAACCCHHEQPEIRVCDEYREQHNHRVQART